MKKKTTALLIICLLLAAIKAYAGSATWNLNPTSGDWNTPTNWTPNTVPNGATDIATFDVSNVTAISISANTTVGGIVFNQNASSFTIGASPNLTLTIRGDGVTNNSLVKETILAAAAPSGLTNGIVQSFDAATAGEANYVCQAGKGTNTDGGEMSFNNNSNAGDSRFTIEGSSVCQAKGGVLVFADNSDAHNSAITVKGGSNGGASGRVDFTADSTGGDGPHRDFRR